MTRTARLSLEVGKEIRALALPWLASLATVVAFAAGGQSWAEIGLPAYFLGVAVLGAWSIGHEQSYRTLGLLLCQPVRRAQIFRVKLTVLGAMLLSTAAVAGAVWPRWYGWGPLLLPVLAGLFVAPWLTILSRSAVGGAVFTAAVPGAFLTAGMLLGALFGRGAEVGGVELTLLQPAMLILCALGAVMGWRRFMRLEVIEGWGAVGLPRWPGRRAGETAETAAPARRIPAFTRRHPMGLLARKELRLQQMPIVVSVVQLLFAFTFARAQHLGQGPRDAFTLIYAAMMSLMIGSFASAEERHLGTLEWQVLVPIAMGKQWAVKLAMAVGLALLLGIGLPVLLDRIILGDPDKLARLAPLPTLTLVVTALTLGGVYVSSLASSGFRAFVASLAAISGATVVAAHVIPLFDGHLRRGTDSPLLRSALVSLVVANLIVSLVVFSLRNHRSADRLGARAWKQLAWMGGWVVVLIAGLLLAELA